MKENAAVLFISGQSNAHAHGQFLKENDYIVKPLKNVFSLDRDPNQSFDITDVVWSGFTTQGKNLGETQDNTYSFAYFFAKLWQDAIDCGVADLPDLYVVQISVGSQGIINGMWNRDKEKVMIPGPLDTVDISLFPWAMQVNRLVMKNLKRSGKKPIVIGWHWIGSEQEIHKEAYNRDDFQERYNYFFDSMLASIGEQCPLFLYKIGCKKYCERHHLPASAVDAVNKALQIQCERHENVTIIDIEKCPLWDALQEHNGVYAEDDAHYLADTQKWFAEEFFAKVIKSNILDI